MNEKIKAALFKIIIALKKHGWSLDTNYEITLQGEGHVPLHKLINVTGDDDTQENIDTSINLKLDSTDQLTYYPEITINSEIFIQGGNIKDISDDVDVEVGFSESDFKDDRKSELAARKINSYVENHIQSEFDEYVNANASAIKSYKSGGWKADDDSRGDR